MNVEALARLAARRVGAHTADALVRHLLETEPRDPGVEYAARCLQEAYR